LFVLAPGPDNKEKSRALRGQRRAIAARRRLVSSADRSAKFIDQRRDLGVAQFEQRAVGDQNAGDVTGGIA
jgi:hypothetical protein